MRSAQPTSIHTTPSWRRRPCDDHRHFLTDHYHHHGGSGAYACPSTPMPVEQDTAYVQQPGTENSGYDHQVQKSFLCLGHRRLTLRTCSHSSSSLSHERTRWLRAAKTQCTSGGCGVASRRVRPRAVQLAVCWSIPPIPLMLSDPTSLVRALAATLLCWQPHLYSHHWVVRRNSGLWPALRGIWDFGIWSKRPKYRVDQGTKNIIKSIAPNSSKATNFGVGLNGFGVPGGRGFNIHALGGGRL